MEGGHVVVRNNCELFFPNTFLFIAVGYLRVFKRENSFCGKLLLIDSSVYEFFFIIIIKIF